jgi:tetratricopeptide (TPR) repeat protein
MGDCRAAELVDIAISTARAWELQGRWDEGAALLHAVLPVTEGDLDREAATLTALVRLRNAQAFLQGPGHADEKAAAIERIAAIGEQRDDRRLQADSLHERALDLHVRFFYDEGDLDAERDMLKRALKLRRGIGDELGAGWSLVYLGIICQLDGDGSAALPLFDEAHDIGAAAGDPILTSYAIRHIGMIRQDREEWEAAEQAFAESLALRERAGWYAGGPAAHLALGSLLRLRGEARRARDHLERAREVGQRLDADRIVAAAEEELAAL